MYYTQNFNVILSSFAVDCLWLPWTNWTECSKECGGGEQHRNRDKIPEMYGGLPCKGESEENRECNTHHCPSESLCSILRKL